MGEWDGKERRAAVSSDEAMWNLLRDIDKKLDLHLETEKEIRPKLDELISLLEMSKGAMAFFRLILYVGAPIGAAVYWIRDHVKL